MTIDIDKEVIIDVDIDVDILFVEGTVRVSNASDISITARVILINTGAGLVDATRASIQFQNGNFFAGSENEPWSCTNTLTIKFTGGRFQPEYGAPYGTVPIGAKTIGVMGGLKLYGCPRDVKFGLLQQTIVDGDNVMTLDRNVTSWSVGDELAIAPTSYDSREAEKVTIVAISGNKVTFSPSVNFTHTGITETQTTYGHMAAEVSLLTRNIKLNGQQDSEDLFGGRVVVLKSDNGFTYRAGWAQIDNVEFVHMGQFGHTRPLDLRTPVAFYHIGTQDDTDPERSFITNSAFHRSYNGAIAIGDRADNMQVTGNVIYDCVGDAIETHAEDTLISDNVITKVVLRALYQDQYLVLLLGNSNVDEKNLPAGINTIKTKTAIVTNNRVAGGDGPAYKGHGTPCNTDDVCTNNNFTRPITNNVAHSTLRGYSIVKEQGRPCAEFSGFYMWRLVDYGIYTQAKGSSILITNNIIIDAIVGICNVAVGNGNVVEHVHGSMKVAVESNVMIGRSMHHTCNDYNIRSSSKVVATGVTGKNRAQFNKRNGQTGLYMPFFLEGFNKFPKVPLHHPKGGGYNSLNGRSCVHANRFINYNDDFMCGGRSAIIITPNPLMVDHTHMVSTQMTELVNVTENNKLFFYRPKLSMVSLDNCVDMPCDGARRSYIKDIDGTFSGIDAGAEVSIFAQSEFQWEGVTGFDWSNNVDPSWGMGDYRVPETMVTATNGTVTPIEEYAPNKGFSRSDTCTWNTVWQAYVCHGSSRGHLLFESLDFDTEIRRSAPIGFRSSTGYIDLANGPKDNSCCSGYACSLRATYNYFLVECGESYDFHTTGTLPTKVQFAMHHLPPTCKVRIQIFTMRQNRQDIYLNGDNIIYSNQYDFVNDTWHFPDPKFIPTTNDVSGANYFDRADQILSFIVGGGDMLQVRIANSLILTLDIVTEMTIEEFYASSNLPYLLASMLGLDPSQVKIVEVVRETNPERYWSMSNTVVTKPHLKGKTVNRVKLEFSTQLGDNDNGHTRSGTGANTKRIGNALVASQMAGELEASIQEASGSNMEIPSASLISSAVEGETPSWYEAGADGQEQSVLTQLGINPDDYEDDSLIDVIAAAAEIQNKTILLNTTNVEEQENLQDTIDKTTKEVRYDAKPTTMVIVQQIPQKVFVGSYMRYPIQVAMLDEKGESMSEVGYMGDPMKITASAPGAGLINDETHFTPGSGIAKFGRLVFGEAGRFNLVIKLTYMGMANVTVSDIYTISFEVTADVPARIEVAQQPDSPTTQMLPLSPIRIVMYDSNDNVMTGDILTANDPWRVCASLPIAGVTTGMQQVLSGIADQPFRNGEVLFDDLSLSTKSIDQQIQFDLCYAGTNDLAELAFETIFTDNFDVINVDECSNNIHSCAVDANCTDTDGFYECICHTGFIGNGFICMQEVDECETDMHDCHANAVCADAPVGFTCSCKSGFGGDGRVCTDIDECFDGSHYCDTGNSICNNTIGGFECICNGGYESTDGKRCTDIDECLLDGICTESNQACVNTEGGYRCQCDLGFILSPNGVCTDMDECADNTHRCGTNSDCENSDGSYECTCSGGGDGGDDQCED